MKTKMQHKVVNAVTTNEHIPPNNNIKPLDWVPMLIRKHIKKPSMKGATDSLFMETGWEKMKRIGVDINDVIDVLNKEHFWNRVGFITATGHLPTPRWRYHWVNFAMEDELLYIKTEDGGK